MRDEPRRKVMPCEIQVFGAHEYDFLASPLKMANIGRFRPVHGRFEDLASEEMSEQAELGLVFWPSDERIDLNPEEEQGLIEEGEDDRLIEEEDPIENIDREDEVPLVERIEDTDALWEHRQPSALADTLNTEEVDGWIVSVDGTRESDDLEMDVVQDLLHDVSLAAM